MVRLGKIMFDLVLSMSVGVLLRLGGAFKKIGFVKNNNKLIFFKSIQVQIQVVKSYSYFQLESSSQFRSSSSIKLHHIIKVIS